MAIPIDNPYDGGGIGSGGGGGGGSGGGGAGGGGTGTAPPDQLPGLAGWQRPRYTFNGLIRDQIPVNTFLNEIVAPVARMYWSMGANGKIRFNNRKPVDWARATGTLSGVTLNFDDVSPWISNVTGYAVIDPHTMNSEARKVIAAAYPTSQNSVTLTASVPAATVISAFAGCDGAHTPATATITIATATAATTYTITLNGVAFAYIPTGSDTTSTVAAFITAALAQHSKLSRKFSFSVLTNVVTIKARFGTLTVDTGLEKTHTAPVADPTVAPTATEIVSGLLYSGDYKLAYTFKNDRGQTNLSPAFAFTIAANENLQIGAITPPAGCTVCWYIVVQAYSAKLRFHSENDGSTFVMSTLPKLDDPLAPEINHTSAEVIRAVAVFSDRNESRTTLTGSNIIRSSSDWSLGDRKATKNRAIIKFRDATQDYREVTLTVSDKAHIAKIHAKKDVEINGNGIDNFFQANRIVSGVLAAARDADFFYKIEATRKALLVEEGDVVAITDNGSGVVNFPATVEEIDFNIGRSGMPTVTFTLQKYSTMFYSDSPFRERVPVATENGVWVAGSMLVLLTGGGVQLQGGAVDLQGLV